MSEVIVKSVSGSLTHEVLSGDHQEHRFLSDEPKELGGENLGPTPYDLLLSALGSCTGITLLLYAKRKNWALSSVKIKLTHQRVHAKDCTDCESKDGYIDRISREITLNGELDESQRQRLLYIAEHCPVHKTLTNEIKIRDSLISSGSPTSELEQQPQKPPSTPPPR